MLHRVATRWILVVVAVAGIAAGCSRSSGSSGSPPDGWKVSKDSTGSCQVSTPADWQIGRDFFLERQAAVSGPFPSNSGLYPANGLELWGVDGNDPVKASPLPTGHLFQVRASVVKGQTVCSVWRIKESTDFTPQELDTMQQVGKTLQAVP
jgi:hypothetical protein